MIPAKRHKTAALFLAVALVGFDLAGCAAARPPQRLPDMKFDALHIEVDPSGNLPPRFWDSYILMEKANALFRSKSYAEAIPIYRKIVDEYPHSELFPLAMFNLAACYEKSGQWEKALVHYQELEVLRGPTIELKELRLRQAACLEELQRWEEAAAVLKRLTEMSSVSQIERIEANIRLGVAYYMMKDYDRAKESLFVGLADYRSMAQKQLPIDTYYVAKGYFFLGEIYFDRYLAIELAGRGDELKSHLEAKADMFIMARGQYLRCLQAYQAVWMSASLYRLGFGYETFYFALKNYPAPEDLTPEQVGDYNRRLGERINNVLAKAIDAYKRNIELAREFEIHSEWVDKTKEHLEYLLNYKKEKGL